MTATKRVTILQEYVPAYRAPLFAKMQELAPLHGISLTIAAGRPHGSQAARGDAASQGVDLELTQKEWSIAGRRLVVRDVRKIYAQSDLVVVEQARRNFDVYAALLWRRRKVAMWGHGRDFTREVGPMSQRLSTVLTNRSTWFFGYTTGSIDAVTQGGFDPSRTTALMNSTDTSTLRSQLASISDLEIVAERRRYGEGPIALFLGGLDSSKRIPFLLEAAASVAKRIPGFSLVVAGAGEDEQLVQRAAVDNSWLHFHEAVHGRDAALLFASADVLAMPGRVGLVAVDALTASLPVVTTDWRFHAPERIYLDDTTCVTSGNDVASFARALGDLLVDESRRNLMRKAAAKPASALSIEAMAERFIDGLGKALDG